MDDVLVWIDVIFVTPDTKITPDMVSVLMEREWSIFWFWQFLQSFCFPELGD
jgi:CRISPR/Cas system-associated endonuclease Cas1